MAKPAMPSYKALGDAILACRLRVDRGWSQEYCWTVAGISRRQWQRLEGGWCLPRGLTWVALKALFPELASYDAK